ncbi:sugar transferase [Prolixibacter denitrificans]|uniref:Exopolysaccharide biosynthesis polyprenyl glycosylphosphotransferase n=1 Tax=Prolixibacter denitrificans TaxID=1541063 RepID=A0A2P8CKF8_9BACT|nr:sugar transferase [Prolixibacter denitrificans]PSK85450.1 exopolysaccharide biosynthesis polyprenyl glycosylphosphotransferase [Prolixibacter denitrificans]GET20070.1 undecaprenyl-phosphate glucose phosphotransferase [Prolixibacter denitrificans]
MKRRKFLASYIISDYLAALCAWILFYLYRKHYAEALIFGQNHTIDFTRQFYLGIILIPLFWLGLYTISGFYNDVLRKSRLLELGQTIFSAVLGSLFIFFMFLLDDYIPDYTFYYKHILALLGIQFILTYIPRLSISTIMVHQFKTGRIGFPTLIIGTNEVAHRITRELESQPVPTGNQVVGYVTIDEEDKDAEVPNEQVLGYLNNIPEVINQHKIEEVIIATESSDHKKLNDIINRLAGRNIIIRGIPDIYDILSGAVKMTTVYSSPLIQISNGIMPAWQMNIKRLLDIFISIIGLIVLSPLSLACIIGVRFSSPGPILYRQERIGRYGKPFIMYKFRSMYNDAEKNGPDLSSHNDQRITRFGRFLRKSHSDEIPQFINVLKGEMSVVGPRPERAFYISKIEESAPHYRHLLRIRPGITSWGQVKYGYAENVTQMIERLQYDLIYLRNMSLYVDFKIIIYTAINILQGRGK